MYGQLWSLMLIALGILTCFAQYDSGAGTLYKLQVVEDVFLERSTSNNNNYKWLIVGRHLQYPKKRSLLRFENIPSGCTNVNHAMMYIYYSYSHKPSWHTVHQTPFITRTIQAHRVLKSWQETQATTTKRNSTTFWYQEYLGLDGTDANYCPTGQTTIYANRPPGFVEIEVTSAVKDWKAGKPNHGLLLWATNEDQNGRDTRFLSKSHNDSSQHPYIQINCD